MIDWGAVKKAAEYLPYGGRVDADELAPGEPMGGIASENARYQRRTRLDEQGFLAPGEYSAARPNTNFDVGRSLGSYYWNYGKGPGSAQRVAVPLGNLRARYYGNTPREQQETHDAMRNRWSRWYQMANPQQRQRLDWYRENGYMPPIPTRGLNELTWQAFKAPDARVNVTAFPNDNARSSYLPDTDTIRLALTGDTGTNQARTRHELAHPLTIVQNRPGSTRRSIVDGISSHDAGEELYRKGGTGSYEMDESEFYRMMFLQKALAAQMGAKRFRNFDEWRRFNNSLGDYRTNVPRSYDRFSQPGIGAAGGISPDDAYSPSFRKTMDDIERRTKYGTKVEKEKAMKQWLQLKQAVQDAIDMAAVNNNKEGVYA